MVSPSGSGGGGRGGWGITYNFGFAKRVGRSRWPDILHGRPFETRNTCCYISLRLCTPLHWQQINLLVQFFSMCIS